MRRGAGQVRVQPPQVQRVALIHTKHGGAFEVLFGVCGARFQPPPLHVWRPRLRRREGRGIGGECRRARIWV
jgi:hypothetical protein